MIFNEYIPTDLLRPYIKAYRIIESKNGQTNRVLPNTSLAIAFRFKGQIGYIVNDERNNLSPLTISGLRKSVRLINYSQNTSAIIVLFKETGAAAFFKEPIHKLFEESVSLDNFIPPRKISIIEEKLSAATSNLQRIAIIERFLLSILYNPKSDGLISTAVTKIHEANGNIRMMELADLLYISQDAFEKRFRKTVGTTPKQFSSIVRMNSIIRNGIKSRSLFDLAIERGYYDQAHFIKEFKLFTGQTPTDFFRSSVFW